MSDSGPGLTGLFLALGSATIYGTSIVFTRLAAIEGISGLSLVVYRVAVMLALTAAAAALWRAPLGVPRDERGGLVVLALATAAIGGAYLSSVAFIPVTVAVVVFYTFPILIVLAGPLVDRTRLTGTLLGVVATALVGVVLVVGPAFGDLDPRGLILAGIASIATTVQFFAATRCRRTGMIAKVLWIHLLVLPVSAAVGLLLGSLDAPAALLLAPAAVLLTIAGYLAGFALQLLALARSSAAVAAIAFCLEPVVAALSSVVVLQERLTPGQMIGGGLVLGAILANALLQQPHGPSS